MAKILLNTLFFCGAICALPLLSKATVSSVGKNPMMLVESCDAPPPTDFEVESMASDLVVLGWEPAWPGATQTLELLIDEGGNWISISTNHNVPGTSFTLVDLEPGLYLARIATNCTNGETSPETNGVLIRFKILDLTLVGRIPKDPKEVEDCNNIDYQNHEWVGFSVTEIETGKSNMFEFEKLETGSSRIKRVLLNHEIVAVNENGFYPDIYSPHIKTFNPFRMDDLNFQDPENLINIGGIVYINNGTNPASIALCKDDTYPIPWKTNYDLKILTAENITDSYPDGTEKSADNSPTNNTHFDKLTINTIFNTYLTLSIPKALPGCEKLKLNIFSTDGVNVASFNFHVNSPTVDVPISHLLPGIYFIQIESTCFTQTFKALKI